MGHILVDGWVDWIGLYCIVLYCIVLDWIVLYWIGLDWIVLYCIVLYCSVLIGAFISIFSNRLVAPQGDQSFEACCQWALLNVQIITWLFSFTVQKYI